MYNRICLFCIAKVHWAKPIAHRVKSITRDCNIRIITNFIDTTFLFFERKFQKFYKISDEFEFYANHYKCQTLNDGNECSQWKTTLKLMNRWGKCHAYLYGDDHGDHFIDMVKLGFLKYEALLLEPFYLKTKLAFHSSKSSPILKENQISFGTSREC